MHYLAKFHCSSLNHCRDIVLLSPQSLTSSTSLSLLVSFTPFSMNLVISSLLKKSTLHKDELSNYRPVYNRFVIFKTRKHRQSYRHAEPRW